MLDTTSTHHKLVFMVTIINRAFGEKITKFFSDAGANFNLITLGRGTASSEILEYLGLGETEKELLLSVMPFQTSRILLEKLAAVIDQPGHGIAFTIPLSSVCGGSAVKYLSGLSHTESEDHMDSVYDHDLIVAIVNRGFSDEVMHAARSAKATGGTVIHARGTGLKEAEKFFGVTIQPEKELILILTQSEFKQDIMKAIATQAGPQTSTNAFVFSLPVNGVIGTSAVSRIEK